MKSADGHRLLPNDPGRRRELEAMIMEENAVDYVFGKAKVTDKAVPFEELMNQPL